MAEEQPTEVDRVQVNNPGQGEAPSVTRVIEVPVGNGPGLSWGDIASGISSGSWAVLLTIGVIWFLGRGGIKAYFEKHFSLLDTMRKSLETNSDSLAKLAEQEKTQSNTIALLSNTDLEIAQTVLKGNKKIDKAISLLYELKDLHEDTHTPINVYPKQLPEKRRARVVIAEEDDEALEVDMEEEETYQHKRKRAQ